MYSVNANYNTIFKAIGYKTRTDILREISKDENLSLKKLSEKFKMSKQTLNYHIRELKLANIIKTKRKNRELLLSVNTQVLNNAIYHLKSNLI